MKRIFGILILASSLAMACGGETASENGANASQSGDQPTNSGQTNQSPTNSGNPGGDEYDGPTYFGDIKPMMLAHCTECHMPGGIAPFPLQNYEEVKAVSAASHLSMVHETMPPWPPNDDCADFKDSRGMTTAEIDLFEEWMDAGHPKGEPSAETEDVTQPSINLGEPDVILDWGVSYRPTPPNENSIDDYRCFVVDPELDEDKFVNLIHTRPDNDKVVHHMIAYTAPASSAEQIAQLEAEDDRPGYECFGGPRVSNNRWLSAWAPGEVPTPFAEGAGIRLEKDTKIIIQMHYNTVNDPEGTDQTQVDLHFLDLDKYPEPTELVIIPLADTDLFVAAGDPEGSTTMSAPQLPLTITVHGVFPHMHVLGTSITLTAETNDGHVCLMDVPNWDFGWQGFYMYEEPIALPPMARVEQTCYFDNSASNQAPGQTPRDVYWGDGTYDEMCLSVIIAELPPEAAGLF